MWHEYERRKADWKAKNPHAKPKEYESAVREIARKVGV